MRRSAFLPVAALTLCPFAALAQTTGGIAGWVTDSSGAPLPHVTVEAIGPSLQGQRAAITAKDGTYRLPALPPGRYVVRATLPGFASVEKTISVGVDATATVRIILQLALRESVFVSGDTPFIDTTSTTAGKTYASNVLIHLPIDRNYADAVYQHPGAVADNGTSQGRSLAVSINGATSAENQWSIDGVNTNNVMEGVQGKAFNNEAIQEIQVQTGGFPAEYGRFLGGMINVVTKSGGNEIHGGAFVYYDGSSLRASRKFVEGEDSPLSGMRLADYRRTDWGASLGGYILKDRLWFFGAYDRTDFPGDVSRLASSERVPSTMQFPLDGTDELYSVKLTWRIADGSTLIATVFSDPTTNSGAGAADPRRSSAVFRDITSPEPGTWEADRSIGAADYGLRFGQVFGSSGFLNLQASRHQDRYRLDPTAEGAQVRTADFTCPEGTPLNPCTIPAQENFAEGGFGDVGGPGNNSQSYRDQFRADLNLYRGAHEIKLGGDYQNAHTTALAHYSGGQLVNRYDDSGTIYYQHIFYTAAPGSYVPASGTFRGGTQELGAYIQDSWSVAPGLTINAGLRWDAERFHDYRDVTVMHLTNEWQPRLGIAWDPWRDGSTKVYASAGRFYYSLPTFVAVREFGGVYGATTWNYQPLDVTPEDVPGHINLPSGPAFGLGELVDGNLHGTSLDEFTVGFERRLSPSLTVGLSASYRSFSHVIEDRCDLDPSVYGAGCMIIDTGGSSDFAQGNFFSCTALDFPENNNCAKDADHPAHPVFGAPAIPRARRIYRGIELSALKSVAEDLSFRASLVYSSLRGNYDGAVNEGFFQTSPGINIDFDYPPLLHNDSGRLYLDRPIDVRVSGFYRTPFRLSVGLDAYVISGPPLERFGYLNSSVGRAPVRLDPRGYAGRMPTQWDANLTLEYPVRVGPTVVTLQAYVFNLFNNQIATSQDMVWSLERPPGYPESIYDPSQPQSNDNYGKVTARQASRLFRASARVSF
jgi:hypothetical protein